MSYLPEHLVVDILLRLPTSSVIRFDCVCKSWYSLFRNPNFMLSHSKNNQQQQLLVQKYCDLVYCDTISLLSGNGDCFKSHCFKSQSLYKFLGRPIFSRFILRVAGSCNGILCLVHHSFNREFVLFNPSIKHYLWLPSPKPLLENPRYDHSVGSGFDNATMDFKILKFGLFSACAEIYSLNSNSWRDISVPEFSHVYNRYGVFVNGALHWVVRMNEKNLIIVFDVKDETFRKIALPSCYVYGQLCHALDVIEFGGFSIAVTQKLRHGSVVWVMKEYGVTESWKHLATIGENWRGNSEVLMIRDQDQVFIRFGLKCLPSLKLDEIAVKNLVAAGERESFSVHRYVPSLFLLDKQNNNPAQN